MISEVNDLVRSHIYKFYVFLMGIFVSLKVKFLFNSIFKAKSRFLSNITERYIFVSLMILVFFVLMFYRYLLISQYAL